MQVTPRTDKEIAKMNLWPAGNYYVEVVDNANLGGKLYQTQDEVSTKTGNDMIVLVLKVYKPDGEFRIMRDWLMDAMPKKIKNATTVFGLSKQYNEGQLYAHDFVGKKGEVKLGIKKDTTGKYADSNSVLDYVVEADNSNAPAGHPAFDDEVPF